MKVKKMVSFSLTKGESIVVPEGEYWKVILISTSSNAGIEINGVRVSFSTGTSHKAEFAQECVIKTPSSDEIFTFQGLAFEI